MNAALAAGALVFAWLLWWVSPYVLDLTGLDAFGDLARVGVVIIGLSVAEIVLRRFPITR